MRLLHLIVASLLLGTIALPVLAGGETLSEEVVVEEVVGDEYFTEASLGPPPEFWGHLDDPACLAVVADTGNVLSGGFDKQLLLWDPATAVILKYLDGHQDAVVDIAVSPDGKRALSCGWDDTVRMWNLATGKQVTALKGGNPFQQHVPAVAYAGDSRAVLACHDFSVMVWDLRSDALITRLAGHTAEVRDVQVTADGTIAISAGYDNKLRCWDLTTFQQRWEWEGPADMHVVALSPDGTQVASGDGSGGVRMHAIADGAIVWELSGHTDWISAIAWSPNGQLLVTAAGGKDGAVRVWNPATGEEQDAYMDETMEMAADAIFLTDSTILMACFDGSVRRWDLPWANPDTAWDG